MGWVLINGQRCGKRENQLGLTDWFIKRWSIEWWSTWNKTMVLCNPPQMIGQSSSTLKPFTLKPCNWVSNGTSQSVWSPNQSFWGCLPCFSWGSIVPSLKNHRFLYWALHLLSIGLVVIRTPFTTIIGFHPSLFGIGTLLLWAFVLLLLSKCSALVLVIGHCVTLSITWRRASWIEVNLSKLHSLVVLTVEKPPPGILLLATLTTRFLLLRPLKHHLKAKQFVQLFHAVHNWDFACNGRFNQTPIFDREEVHLSSFLNCV